jgi:hypothetical protein
LEGRLSLCEVLFLVVCGTIANCDDYEDIVDWGAARTCRLLSAFHHGIPCAEWLRTVLDRIDPDLFMLLFVLGRRMLAGEAQSKWRSAARPRRSHNRKTGQKALHLVSAFATNSRRVLGQEAVCAA